MKGFIEFIRQQGVVGLAVGFILGGAVSQLVSSFVQDIISPVLGLIMGSKGALANRSLLLGDAEIMWGNFLSISIDFIIIAFIVYYLVKGLRLDKLDKKQS